MKKENSAVRLDMAEANASKIEAVPSSPASPDSGKTNLETEARSALDRFKANREKLIRMDHGMRLNLPPAGWESEKIGLYGKGSTLLEVYDKKKSELLEFAELMQKQIPELKELEYLVVDPALSKEIKQSLKLLEDLYSDYINIEPSEAVKARKVASQENINVQLRNREQIELKEQEDKARKATAVMRRDLANLKRSFYKMYGMTFNEALVLPSSSKPAEGKAPKGFWGKLADKVWEKPKSDDEKKLEAAKSKDAKALIKRIQGLDKQIESAWNNTMGQYAQESEPQTAISLDTLRSVLEQEMPEKSPKEIDDSAYRIMQSLRLAVPEDVKEIKKEVDMSNVHELKPERIEKPEPSVVIKTETQERPQKEVPTLKVAREEKPAVEEAEKSDRRHTAIEIMQIFGGGEQARQRGSNLFEAVKNQMQLMKLEDMDPLDYVQLVAERTQAENSNDKKAAKEYEKQIQALNKKLDFGSTDPSKGINMDGSRLMEARALGSTPARAEAAKMVEQIAAMPSQKAERPTLRKPKLQMEEVESKEEKEKQILDWTMNQLGQESAASKWNEYSKKMEGVKGAKEMVIGRINELLAKINELNKTGEAKSFENLELIKNNTSGDPREATMAVILHAAKKEAAKANKKVEALISAAIDEIDEDLESETRPTLQIIKKEKPSLRLVKEELSEPEVPQKKETIPPPPEFLSTSVEYRKLADELLDKSEVPFYVPNIKGLAKLVEGGKKKSPKEAEALFYAIAEGMNLRSMAELGEKNKNKIDAETLEYIKTKEDEWIKKANDLGKKFGLEIANAQGTGFIQKGAWELKNITNEDYEELKNESLGIKNFETIQLEIEKSQAMDEQGVSDYLVVVQNYLENLGKEDWQASAAERAWKELDRSLGLNHTKMKKLAVEGKK